MAHPDDRLSAYVDGTLPQTDAADVAAHLAECRLCRDTVADLTAVRALLGRVTPPVPHPSLLPRTMARLASARPRRAPLLRRLAVLATTAAAILLVLQVRLLPPRTAPEARDWYFRTHAQLSVVHPMADVALASYLGTTLPYPSLERLEVEGPR